MNTSLSLKIGKLGMFTFPAGNYLYCGSALGNGGIQSRLNHHLNIAQKPHWHIDWLRPYIKFTGLYYVYSTEHLECLWVSRLKRNDMVNLPVPGFGASDCEAECGAHLLFVPDPIKETDIEFIRNLHKDLIWHE